jgi:hypothetical protein
LAVALGIEMAPNKHNILLGKNRALGTEAVVIVGLLFINDAKYYA